MGGKARKIKFRVRKGRWFVLFFPALSFKFAKKICGWGLKFSAKGRTQTEKMAGKGYNESGKFDMKELMKDLEFLFDEMAKIEPFVLVEASDDAEKLYVKIETI